MVVAQMHFVLSVYDNVQDHVDVDVDVDVVLDVDGFLSRMRTNSL
jgi:hypothetical protein